MPAASHPAHSLATWHAWRDGMQNLTFIFWRPVPRFPNPANAPHHRAKNLPPQAHNLQLRSRAHSPPRLSNTTL